MLFQEGLSQKEIEHELCHDITGKQASSCYIIIILLLLVHITITFKPLPGGLLLHCRLLVLYIYNYVEEMLKYHEKIITVY